MAINKPHLEFHAIDMSTGWERPAGYPEGIDQKILAGALDESAHSGSRTRLLRFRPGVFTTAPFVHDYWEEVYLLQGDLTVGNDAEGRGRELRARHLCLPPARRRAWALQIRNRLPSARNPLLRAGGLARRLKLLLTNYQFYAISTTRTR